MNNRTHFYIHEWPQDDQDRLIQGYHEINCLKAKLNYSNDDKHFLKLRKDLENQVNPTTPKPRTKPTPTKPTPKPTPVPTNTKSTTGSASIDPGTINLNISNLENQVSPKVPRKLKQNNTESTTGLTSIDSGSISFNVSNVKFLFLFSQLFLIFSCTCMLHI